MKVTPDQFGKAVVKALAEYGDDLYDIAKGCAKESGRDTAKQIKATAPTRTGEYARSWTHKEKKGGQAFYTDAVYNRTRGQIVHLLEKPHATRGGGHYPTNVDYTGTIARIEEEQTQKFMERVLAKL